MTSRIKSCSQFLSRNLFVFSDIVGKSHCFEYENVIVTIQLLDISHIDEDKNTDQAITVIGWNDSTDEPLEYKIHVVNVDVEIQENIVLNYEVLNANINVHKPIRRKEITEEEQSKLDTVIEKYKGIAERAYRYWISILRWIVDDYRIGRNIVLDNSSGNTRLKTTDTNIRLWLEPVHIEIKLPIIVKINHWQIAQEKLNKQEEVPIYILLKYDAEEYFDRGEYRRALIDMAISCEAFLRLTVLKTLPNDLSPKIIQFIEEADISKYHSNFFKELVKEENIKEYNKLVQDGIVPLLKKRNKIVHIGNEEGIDKECCEKYLRVNKELLTFEAKINYQ